MDFKYLFAKLMRKIQIPSIKNSRIDKTSKVCSGAQINDCIVGKYTYIGNFTDANYVTIGNFCSIGDRCIIGGGSHTLDWVSTSPVFHKGRNCMNVNFTEKEYMPYENTIIGNDVWIATGVFIKGGLKISDGAVIGMGSVVTKNIGPYEVWAGNPARLIKKRFDDETIKKLLESNWWDMDDDSIKLHSEHIDDINLFLGGDK